jgi:hypothetical protein
MLVLVNVKSSQPKETELVVVEMTGLGFKIRVGVWDVISFLYLGRN